VTKPEPILHKAADGGVEEPYEHLIIDVPQEYLGSVMELVGTRRGEMTLMNPLEEGQVRVEFSIPARGLIGFCPVFLTETKGYGIMNHAFSHYGMGWSNYRAADREFGRLGNGYGYGLCSRKQNSGAFSLLIQVQKYTLG